MVRDNTWHTYQRIRKMKSKSGTPLLYKQVARRMALSPASVRQIICRCRREEERRKQQIPVAVDRRQTQTVTNCHTEVEGVFTASE